MTKYPARWMRSNGEWVDIEDMNDFHLVGAWNKCVRQGFADEKVLKSLKAEILARPGVEFYEDNKARLVPRAPQPEAEVADDDIRY